MNITILTGRLGKDPEFKTLENSRPVARVSMATTEYFKKKDSEEFQEETQWHNVIFWGYMAEKIKTATKGTMVLVHGKIKYREYTDKNGDKKYITEIYAEHLEIIKTGGSGSAPMPTPDEKPSYRTEESMENDSAPLDDLPF